MDWLLGRLRGEPWRPTPVVIVEVKALSAPEVSSVDQYDRKADDAQMRLDLSWLRPYRPILEALESEFGFAPRIGGGILSRESGGGRLLHPMGGWGLGDNGHGHSPWQIDDRSELAWLKAHAADWGEPEVHTRKALEMLATKRKIIQRLAKIEGDTLLQATIAAYNCGEGNVIEALKTGQDVDSRTAHKNYSADVLGRRAWLREFDAWA